jgi:hypothetical protein
MMPIASIFRFDAAGAHHTPAACCLKKTKSTVWNQRQTEPAARDQNENSGDDQENPEHAANDPPSPVNVWHEEFFHNRCLAHPTNKIVAMKASRIMKGASTPLLLLRQSALGRLPIDSPLFSERR